MAANFFVKAVQDTLELTQRAFLPGLLLEFIGHLLRQPPVGFLGGDAPLLAARVPETGGPIFGVRMFPNGGHKK